MLTKIYHIYILVLELFYFCFLFSISQFVHLGKDDDS